MRLRRTTVKDEGFRLRGTFKYGGGKTSPTRNTGTKVVATARQVVLEKDIQRAIVSEIMDGKVRADSSR
jgi:hypothetical protein